MKKEQKQYQTLLSLLLNSPHDEDSTKDAEYAEQLKNVHDEFVTRNKALSKLLNEYITQWDKRSQTNNFFKKFIFWWFVGLFFIMTIVVIIVFIKVDINNAGLFSVISLLSVAGTYLGSIISVFRIMSKYLFPLDEEKDTIRMLEAVLGNDTKVEEMISKAINENHGVKIEHLRKYKALLDEEILDEEEYTTLKTRIIEQISK